MQRFLKHEMIYIFQIGKRLINENVRQHFVDDASLWFMVVYGLRLYEMGLTYYRRHHYVFYIRTAFVTIICHVAHMYVILFFTFQILENHRYSKSIGLPRYSNGIPEDDFEIPRYGISLALGSSSRT